MHIEIAQAVEFLGRLLQSKVDQDVVGNLKETLTELLKVRFEDHWDPQQPCRGNGYRALSNFNGQLDPMLNEACIKASIQPSIIHAHLPRDFVLWIDPFSVSYRVGDHGNIMTLFEDRSRGRISLKLDPSLNSTSATTNTTTTAIAAKSPSNSPMMQYLQPRASTPIRISPPNSPESLMLKNQQNSMQSSPLGKKNGQDKSNKGLVMAV
ncbi:protein BTG1-like [Mucor ambiguus]|uniref:Protein BTG1-like n=1 Tax=Mucor ambiguus TaxID=91626 RepID=A0A0C9M683_9FUNG|nr:protein BTG1-like [Mucor ambiguus]